MSINLGQRFKQFFYWPHFLGLVTMQDNSTQQIRFIRKREVMRRTGLTSSGIYDLMSRISSHKVLN